MTENPNDIVLRIGTDSGGIPLNMAGFLAQAIALAYPGTTIGNADGLHQMVLRIPEGDYLNLDPDGVSEKEMTALMPGKDDPGLIAFTTGLHSDASFGVAPPPWLGQFLSRTADLIEKHSDAPNYLEMTIAAKDGSSEPFKWLVCRRGRPSPHEFRQRAEARVQLLEQQLHERDAEVRRLTAERDHQAALRAEYARRWETAEQRIAGVTTATGGVQCPNGNEGGDA